MKSTLTIAFCLAALGVCHADLWEPWRKDAKGDGNCSGYTVSTASPMLFKPWAETPKGSGGGVMPQSGVGPEEPRFYAIYDGSNKAPKATFEIPFNSFTQTQGCELAFRFRVANLPAKLDASHSLATFQLAGPSRKDGFFLHVYRPPKAGSTKTGFMLNNVAKKGQWKRVSVARGPVLPAEVIPLDHAWHTVRIAWCVGEMKVFFDGLLSLHVFDPAIDYRSFSVVSVQPGGDGLLQCLGLSAIEARPAIFNQN